MIFFILNLLLPRRITSVFDGYDFVFLWLFGGLAASPLVNSNVSFTHSIAAMLAVSFCHIGLSKMAISSPRISRLITGRPVILVKNGKVLKENMRQALVPTWILLSELRSAGLADFSQVEYAVLECCGRISIIPKVEFWPVTARDLNMRSEPVCSPYLVVEDGKIVAKNLARLGYDEKWLRSELARQGVARLTDVYIASVDARGRVYVSCRE